MKRLVTVQPVSVPWMVSPSVPDFHLSVNSNQPETAAILNFLAFFGHDNTFDYVDTYARISITFSNGFWVKYYPKSSDNESKILSSYDWELVPEFRDESGSLKGSKLRFREYWQQTSICPDPSMYRLINSDWVCNNIQEYEHYLIMGNDFNVEVMCKSYSWKLEV
ncbi:hypothetical protein D0962_28205 [Leptolyngbyaceae cyanobacterium CCMR0082]|uniref:Uncharacterized protein n=1 Tax=Adonisia turfae CCMR0082 TaxID=2304604 RepID=A0A6M0SDP1_9CYAN|nr:hypothetical protein [Adonisia turfae]NEZ66599.1 hypothetical protein [Adonisia turfae CCMR0082]